MAHSAKPPATSPASYHGEVWTDARGFATVRLPIEAAPLDPPLAYELRDLDPPSSARVTAELEDGHFTIATDEPHVKVAWRVTGHGPGRARTRSGSPRSLRAALLKRRPVSERGQRTENPKPHRGEVPLEQPRADAPDAAAQERLERNLTPAIAEVGEGWPGYLRYAAGALVAVFVVVGATFALNAIVDPFSLVGTRLLPTAIENDRTTKLDLIDKLKTNPQVVVLGSSRSRQAQPSYIDKLTGLKTGFNAGVTGGTAADAWVMIRNVGARFPHGKRTYIWFLDYRLATDGINPELAQDPRSRPYLGNRSVRFSLADVGTYIGFQATRASYRVLRDCIEGRCHGLLRYNADGSINRSTLRYLPEHAKSLRLAVKQHLAQVAHQSPALPPYTRRQFLYFDKALAWMNAQGATPVIVLNPIYPSIYRVMRKRHSRREQQALAQLHKLQKRFRFVVVDCSDIHRWHGKPSDFSNATHVDRRNMQRMLKYIVANSHGALG